MGFGGPGSGRFWLLKGMKSKICLLCGLGIALRVAVVCCSVDGKLGDRLGGLLQISCGGDSVLLIGRRTPRPRHLGMAHGAPACCGISGLVYQSSVHGAEFLQVVGARWFYKIFISRLSKLAQDNTGKLPRPKEDRIAAAFEVLRRIT